MTAGRGIVHAEMPAGDGVNTGLQLWINLKQKDKVGLKVCVYMSLLNINLLLNQQMIEPQYQELLKNDIPHVSKDGVHVAVIAGECFGVSVSE